MIPIRNIYYMLSYAFQALQGQGYKKLDTEEFTSAGDLFAAILCRGVELQIKQGLGRTYIEETSTRSSLQGKIEIAQSMKDNTIQRKELVCTYEIYSENSKLNQILKSTMRRLLHSDIQAKRKKEIRRLLAWFGGIGEIDLMRVDWRIQFNRNNQNYQMLIGVCQLVVQGLLQTQRDGSTKLMDFLDEQRMCRLYEKFILEYYRKEHPEIRASASQIEWMTDDGYREMLPAMQTDITLEKGQKVLIIDAKYYEDIYQTRFERQSINSGNLYQIFTYVKNRREKEPEKEIAGMLLYANTGSGEQPKHRYSMSGNRISVWNLDLNREFGEFKKQLDEIAEKEEFWTA